MKKVSIIIPAYNASKYLHKCLDSVVAQTLDDYEVIIVNDGSKDDTWEIIEEYRDKYPDKIKAFTKENGGQATARNLALKYAEGEYIGCVDADDYISLDMFKRLYDTAKEEDYDVVSCESYTVKGDDIKVAPMKDYDEIYKLYIDEWVSPCIRIVKKEIYDNSGLRFPEGYIYEDTAWFCDLIPYINKYKTIHEPLYYRMINENSTMTTAQGKRTAQIFPLMRTTIDFYKEKGLYDKFKNELEYFYTRILFLSSFERISRIKDYKLRHEYANKTLSEVRENFPNYKNNPYLSGKRKLWIKITNRLTVNVMIEILRLKSLLKK